VRTFVPANQIIHIFRKDRMKGIRGIPWMTATMPAINMLGELLNAELASAIVGARQTGVIQGQFDDDAEDESDTSISEDPRDTAAEMTSEECSLLGVAPGQKVTFPPAPHPNPHLSGFSVTLLHSIAAGNQVAYHSLTNDVSQANYSSARVALLNERDNWKKLQRWYIHQAKKPLFHVWLEMAVLSGQLKLPSSTDLNMVAKSARWWARSWDWVDPEKDIKSSIMAIRAGLSTHAEELGQQGRNWRKTFAQLAVEQSEQRRLGVHVELDLAKGSNLQPSDLADPTSTDTDVQNPAESVEPAKGDETNG
jgi:lambda family phage portal protein